MEMKLEYNKPKRDSQQIHSEAANGDVQSAKAGRGRNRRITEARGALPGEMFVNEISH